MQGFDRPTTKDRFNRGSFVSHVFSSLVANNRATELVVGLTGEWGSGKSSILNQVRGLADKEKCAVFSFVPWMISDVQSLIGIFLAELARQAGVREGDSKSKISDLINIIAPAANMVINGVGDVAKSLSETLLDKGLEQTYLEYRTLFENSTEPIVVLIDELDRLDDDEVKTVFRLVKAIGDLPNVSYLLAYDKTRICEALSGGRDEATGRAFVEKIVQIEFSLPYLAPNQASVFLEKLLSEVAGPDIVSLVERDFQRFSNFLSLVIPNYLSTPRDIKKLVQAWNVKWQFLKSEVDWLDLLGFCLLEQKIPDIVRYIRDDPGAFANNGISRLHSHTFSSALQENIAPSFHPTVNRLEAVIERLPNDDAQNLRYFLELLFPILESSGGQTELPRERSKSIGNEEVLVTLLTYGQPDQKFLLETITQFVHLPAKLRHLKLVQWYKQGDLSNFFERLFSSYSDLEVDDHCKFWREIASTYEECTLSSTSDLNVFRLTTFVERALSQLVEKNKEIRQNFANLLKQCLQDSSFNLTSYLLWLELYHRDNPDPEYELRLTDEGLDKMFREFVKRAISCNEKSQEKLSKISTRFFFFLVEKMSESDADKIRVMIAEGRHSEHVIRLLLSDDYIVDERTLVNLLDTEYLVRHLLANHSYYNLLNDPGYKEPGYYTGNYSFRKFMKIIAPEKFRNLENEHV